MGSIIKVGRSMERLGSSVIKAIKAVLGLRRMNLYWQEDMSGSSVPCRQKQSRGLISSSLIES